MLNRKGYSMVEVIICLAVLAVLSVSAFSLSGHIKYANTKKCAKELNQTLEKARMISMSKTGDWQLYLYKQSDGLYYNLTNVSPMVKSQGKKIGGKNIKLYYVKKGGSETLLDDSTVLQVRFSKSTGAYTALNGSVIYENLRIAGDTGKGYTIELVEKTGKHIFMQ